MGIDPAVESLDSRTSVLYLCYQSILEPLTETQVVAYLEGLSLGGYRVILLTFEPRPLAIGEEQAWRARLRTKGVTWHWVRYHKHPRVPATAWDIASGALRALQLAHRYQVSVVHARAHVAGLMAIALKKLMGVKLLFDVRGFMAEEYADAGLLRPDGRLFRVVKRAERHLVRTADGIVVLTEKARGLVQKWYGEELQLKPIKVIPCCADMRMWGKTEGRNEPRSSVSGGTPRPVTFLYVGKLGGVYLTEAMTAFVAAARDRIGPIRWHIWTQSDPATLEQCVRKRALQSEVTINRAPPEVVASRVGTSDVGLTFMKPSVSRLATSPTKVGEYLASGLPVAVTVGIGDLDEVLRRSRVGVSIAQFTDRSYFDAIEELKTLIEDADTPARCYAVARECFDLERVGWPRYIEMYQQLLG